MTIQLPSAIEMQRQAAQADLDAKKSSAERNRLGQFATPQSLALEIAQYLRTLIPESTSIRFADPSIGSGSFFSAALSTFGPERIKSAVGVEIDDAFCAAARELWAHLGLKVICDDFTRLIDDPSRPPAPNLVLANPPYVRHHHLGRVLKQRLQMLARQMAKVEVSGLAGLYVYFVLLATTWMEEGGHAAWLIPSEFMDVNYGAALKHFLTNNVALLRVHRFDPANVQFGDALVSSVILVFRKGPPDPNHAIEFTFGDSIHRPDAIERVHLAALRHARKWSVYPKTPANDRHTSGDSHGPVLGDLFRIQRGVATGDNRFFILDRSEATRLALPEQYLRPILPSPRFLKDTILEADANGYPLINAQLCLIDCDLPEFVVEEKFPTLWTYLKTAEVLDVKSSYLVKKRAPWYKQEQRAPAPFLCTYMGRGSHAKQPFRFIWNRSAAIATNLYLMIYPQKKLTAMLRSHPDRAREVHSLLGEITGHELRGEGRVYGGGLHKIEPAELARISATPIFNRWPELAESQQSLINGTLFT